MINRRTSPAYPKTGPQFAWAVKDEAINHPEEHSWVICTRCETVSFYDLPKLMGASSTQKWISDNVKCLRCKAFASKLGACTEEQFADAVDHRRNSPPPAYGESRIVPGTKSDGYARKS